MTDVDASVVVEPEINDTNNVENEPQTDQSASSTSNTMSSEQADEAEPTASDQSEPVSDASLPVDKPADNQSESAQEVVENPVESQPKQPEADVTLSEAADITTQSTDSTSSLLVEQPAEPSSSKPEVEESKSVDEQPSYASMEESKSIDDKLQSFEETKVESSESETKKEETPIDARALLRQELMDFVTYVIQHQPADAFKQIESIIASLKSNKSLKSQSNTSPISHIVPDDKERLALLSYLRSLTDKPVKPVNPDDEDAEPETDAEPAEIPEFIPHLMRDLSLFSQAGLAVSNDEFQMLDRAIISLAQQTEGLESVRFWGKLFAVNGKDYYIAECKKSDYSAEEESDRVFNEKILNETGELVAERAEVWGAGLNEFVYYACQSINQSINPWTPTKWVTLPSVTPIQIRAACGSRRLLTGDLAAPVGGFPRFPGNESHYLRTQIARISHSTIIAPTSAWKEEEGGIVMENDEFKAHHVNEAVSWQHIRGHLREEGRVEPFVDEEAEQSEDAEAHPKEPVETIVPALRPTVDDVHSVGPRVWTYRSNLAIDCGFQPSQKPSNPDDEEEAPPASEPHCVYSAHSLLWPGGVSVVHGRNYASCYIGWGLKRDRNTAYRPPPPAPFQREYAQPMTEQTEPKPSEAELEELKREADEEAERKKEEGEKPVEEEDDDPLPDDEPEEQAED